MKVSLVFFLLVLGVLSNESTAIQYTPKVIINSGKIRGVVSTLNTGGTVRKYLGIPFAKAERFENPTDPQPWSDVKDVTTVGKACPQTENDQLKLADMSEDCLNLNVFVPEGAGSPLPVMVWIHGGGFIGGNNRYDGSYIASLGNVIVLTINYRLNLFGFLATNKDGDLKGNYGMLDQVYALRWVQQNIKAFSGDPDKVTIFGMSAGGVSASLLVLSPLAKGLFHNAILQSGDAVASTWAYKTYSEALDTANLVAKHTDCSNVKTLDDCLRGKNVQEIVDILFKVYSSERMPTFRPVVDGVFLPDVPGSLLSSSRINKVGIMMGITDDDGSVLVASVPGLSWGPDVSNGISRDNFIEMVLGKSAIKLARGQNQVISEAILYRYTDWNNVTDRYRTRRMLLDMYTDSLFIAPAIKSAKYFINDTINTYLYQLQYRFDYYDISPVPRWVKAYHGADVAAVFGQPLRQAAVNKTSVYTKDANFSREIIKIWSNFAKTGNPNTPGDIGLVWPQYDLLKQQYMALKPNMAVQTKLRNDHVAFWNSFVPAAIKSMPKLSPPPRGSGTRFMSGVLIAIGLPLIVISCTPLDC